MSRHLKWLCSPRSRAAAAVVVAALLLGTDWAQASMSSGSSRSSRSSGGGLSSSRNSSSSRSRNSSRDNGSEDDFGDTGGSDSRDSGSRRGSSNRRSGSSRSSRSSSSHGGGRGFSSGGRSSKPEPPPFVFGSKFERDGVRPHGTVLSSTAFADLPGQTELVSVSGTNYYRRNNAWYQRIEQDGWTCYAEIYPPAGVHVSWIPKDALALNGDGKTYYATDDAVYAPEPGAGYVVVEPPVGMSFDRLPASAKTGIPVVVDGTSYYRHLGLFYREDKGPAGARYVVTKSPYLIETTPPPVAPTMADTASSAMPLVHAVAVPDYENDSSSTDPPAPGSPRAVFLLPTAELAR